MTNITKDTQFRVIGTESKSPLVYIDEVAEYINAGGGGGQPTVTVNDITDATTVGKNVLLASTQVQARTAIGAGTSDLTIGTTATTAKAGDYAPPNASTTVAGLMLATDKVKLDGIEARANNYFLPLATAATRGGIKVGYVANGRNYPVKMDGEKAYVNVPWTDTNTTYDLSPYAKKVETVDFSTIRVYKETITSTPQGLKEKQVILFTSLGGKGGSIELEEATSNMSGLMSIRDKNKLSYIADGATADSAITTAEIDALFA